MYALFQLKTCLRRILYTTVIDATICSKPGYLPLFYLTVGCKVLLYVSRNARMQKKSWVLHRIINVSTLPFPSSHVPPVSECSRLISAKVVYNITDRESLIASRWHKFYTKRFKCYLLSYQQKLSKMWRSSSHGKLISYS